MLRRNGEVGGVAGPEIGPEHLLLFFGKRLWSSGRIQPVTSEQTNQSQPVIGTSVVGSNVPHPRRPGITGGDDAAAVRTEPDMIHPSLVLQRGRDGLACGCVPHPCRTVPTGGGDAAAV